MQQLVAAEALIAATQKKKDSSFIVSNGVEILKQLYRSKNDHIKVIFQPIKNQKCYCYFSKTYFCFETNYGIKQLGSLVRSIKIFETIFIL